MVTRPIMLDARKDDQMFMAKVRMTRRGMMGGLIAGAATLLTGCGAMPFARYRFRMTVEVATPQGLKSGAGVMEILAAEELFPVGDGHRISAGLLGEAVAVDLSSGPLFVLIGNVQSGDMLNSAVTSAFEPEARLGSEFLAAVEKLGNSGQKGRTAVLPRESYPMFVRFRDVRDPLTVEQVDPGNLADSFGDGVRLRRVVVEIVGDPVSRKIENKLTWLDNNKEAQLNPTHGPLDYSLPSMLTYGAFKR